MTALPRYREEALREIRAANAPKLFAIAERVREAMEDHSYFAKRNTSAEKVLVAIQQSEAGK